MIRAHKIALDPNDGQETYFRKAAGTARFAYNWALAEWQRQYDAGKADPTWPKPSDPALRKPLNAILRSCRVTLATESDRAPRRIIFGRNLGARSKK